MGDVKIAQTATHISKTTLNLERPQADTYPPEAPAFTLPPRNIRIPVGGTARFDGKVRGRPEPHITWYKNGQPIPKNDRYITEQSTRGTFSLVIKEVQKEDAGKYTCETANVGGVRQVTVELTVQEDTDRKYGWPSNTNTTSRYSTPSIENRPSIWGESPPKFVTKPTRLIVKEGQNGKFSCKITGRPHPRVIWLKGDTELQQSDHFNMFEKSGIHCLEIRAVQAEDAGNYVCLLMNNSGKAMATVELILQRMGSTPEIASVQQGNNGAKTLEPLETKQTTANGVRVEKERACTVTIQAKESLKVVNHTVAASEKQKPEIEQRIEKSIEENKSHSEPKTEIKKTGAGKLQEESRKITEHKSATRGSPPDFLTYPQNQAVAEGEEVKFTCKIAGSPKPEVKWAKNGVSLKEKGGVEMYEKDGIQYLGLRNVNMADNGSYSCIATNRRGQFSRTWTLSVKGSQEEDVPPFFTSVLKECKVSEGQDFVLQCSLDGKPQPQITWLVNGKENISTGTDSKR
ncbi:hypothetical protein scyTo_0006284 [Scyliorhinus torazame]|uniref:Ig-like domain-containing protein n=1 Tax=Scyliorhinus torazame TaxID=75743 RepID=A0A401PGZ2_SCYTO|nr:hypothetical protein [Scyliorhinus torazame]